MTTMLCSRMKDLYLKNGIDLHQSDCKKAISKQIFLVRINKNFFIT